jgi:hypothetical protein
MTCQLEQKTLVEFKTAGELLHDLPCAINKEEETRSIVFVPESGIAQGRTLVTPHKGITRLYPLAFNQGFETCLIKLIIN